MRTRTARLTSAAAATALASALVALAASAMTAPAAAGPAERTSAKAAKGAKPSKPAKAGDVRFATFNASLNRSQAGVLVEDLSTPGHAQAAAVAETIQRTDPDVLLINEFDYVEGGQAAELFRDNYLEVGHNGAPPVDYPYYFVAPVNTGVPSGFDLNNKDEVGKPGTPEGAEDSFGFGFFPGQYGMVVYSKYPIATDDVRTFQHFLWKDMPGALLPTYPVTGESWYSPAELEKFRLSSKSHWDVPIKFPGRKPVHFLVSHPTPPTFDGGEDRNGKRNHDEIRFWADYVSGGATASYIYDDAGGTGGLGHGQDFVIAGDQNADPIDGDSFAQAIDQLLDHPRVQDPHPTSAGAVEQAVLQGGANLLHKGPHAEDTADFDDDLGRRGPGNLRVDYILPSERLTPLDAGVYWLRASDPLFPRLVGTFPFPASDHRLVWVDVRLSRG